MKDGMDPDEFQAYTEKGLFIIRRSNRFWCCVWSDMTIEQVLMRAMKVSGGLTRGRGITESTLAKWVRALPLCKHYVPQLRISLALMKSPLNNIVVHLTTTT